MRIQFLGGAQTVTGAAYAVETERSLVLVDCGLFQGSRSLEERNRQIHLYRPQRTDSVVLTHAHMDHAGLLPAFAKGGFRGNVYCTPATRDLCEILLLDSAHIQEMEAEWQTRKNLRGGRKTSEPLYCVKDAREALRLLRPVPYQERVEVAKGTCVRFQDAGHILGSASVEMWVTEADATTKLVFSGDVGRKNQPIIRDPQTIEEAEVLLVESTYGDRSHKSTEDTVHEFLSIVQTAVRDGEKMIVPAFAVGRTQEVLYILHEMQRQGTLPPIPVYVDSPLATAATEIFRHHPECFDADTRAILQDGDEPLSLPKLTFTRTTEESRAINETRGPAIVIAASGMCNAGRILHHLKHNLWRPRAHIVIIGYQAEGTMGRLLVDGAKSVRIFREPVAVRASIHTLGGFSAHADREELLNWVAHFRTPGLKIFVVHGEEKSAQALAGGLRERGFADVRVPAFMESVDVTEAPEARTEVSAPPSAPAERLLDLERRLRRLRKRAVRLASPPENAGEKFARKADQMMLLLEEMQALLEQGIGRETERRE